MPRTATIALCLAAGLACSGVRVSTDYDPEFDFSALDTYAWLDDRSGVEGDRDDVRSLLDRRIRAAIDDTLEEKGLSQSERGEAPLLVTYHLGIEKKLDIDTIETGFGYGRGWYGGLGTTQTVVREYEEGTLLIDLVEADSRQLVWRGSGQSRIRKTSTPEQSQQRVREVVSEILKRFPPGAGR